MKFVVVLAVCLLAYVIWQYFELQKFRVTEYTVSAEKLHSGLKVAVIADLHSHVYGKENERLIAAIKQAEPDMILIPGDMIISAYTQKYGISLQFFQRISEIAPVYFSNGNHESKIEQPQSAYYEAYGRYRAEVEKTGVHILNNQSTVWTQGENRCRIYGLDIPLECYEKGHVTPLPEGFLAEQLGACDKQTYSILLAHNPAYCEEYAAWGADLILCGHMHGGLIRIPGVGSVISPQFEWFPKYDAGKFSIKSSTAIISKGLGTHTFHIRIFNRAELLVIHLE